MITLDCANAVPIKSHGTPSPETAVHILVSTSGWEKKLRKLTWLSAFRGRKYTNAYLQES